MALHCSHRGTSLEYGRVEEHGIRCCYHGWLYDIRGNCLEQPAEPADSTFKDRVRHPAYHAQDAGGLIFAYIGPEPAALLPSYDLLVREDGCRILGGDVENCNWLQRAENSADGAHSIALHAPGYPNMIQVHRELEEAAQVGGASTFRVLTKIIAPLIKPGLVYVWIWTSLSAYRELTMAVFLASPKSQVLSTYIWGQWHGGGLGDAAAIAIVMIAMMSPLVTCFWIYARKQQHVASSP